MDFLSNLQLSLIEIYFVIFTVFIASIIRGFNGFGFSATCISGFSFILPAIEIVPIILILEVIISIFMVPYIWNKIDWNFVLKLLFGIIIGSPIGLFLLKYLPQDITHLTVCILVIFFSLLSSSRSSISFVDIIFKSDFLDVWAFGHRVLFLRRLYYR